MNRDNYIINNHSLINVRNVYELKVIKYIKELAKNFPDFDECQCCIEDVYALSLSRIPPTYVRLGSVENREEMAEEDIKEIVSYAIYQVSSNPKHSRQL